MLLKQKGSNIEDVAVYMQVCVLVLTEKWVTGGWSDALIQIIQINQPTRCNNSSSLLLDVYVQLSMFLASSRPSSGAQQLQ
jgi:hypothetical protein